MTLIRHWIRTTVIILFVLSLSIFLVINTSFIYYWLGIYYFHLNSISGLNSTSLMKCYFFMLKYLQVPWDARLNLVFFKSSVNGLTHFRNVKLLIMLNNIGTLIFGGLSLRIVKQDFVTNMLWKLISPLKVVLTSFLILITMALIDFQAFFIYFHRVMFRNQDWVFNANLDPVITVLPTAFFAWCFIAFTIIFIMILSLLVYYSKYYSK